MPTTLPQGPQGGPRLKTRDDDARGAPPGDPSKPRDHKRDGTEWEGRRGNLPFVPTEEQREQARTYAKAVPLNGERFIARKMKISLSTLRRYFADDMEEGRADVAISLGAQMVNGALDANSPTVKGDIERQKFVLARLCGWTTKIETGEKASRPFGGDIDLSRLDEKQLEDYGRLSAIAEGLDPEEVLGDAGS